MDPLLITPIAFSLVILIFASWQRRGRDKTEEANRKADEAALRKAQALQLPKGSLEMLHDWIPSQDLSAILGGKIFLLLAGTFAASLAIRLLKLLERCGLDAAIGAILLIEPDKSQREKFLEDRPPIFQDRLVVVECSSIPGGGANRSPAWLKRMREYWVKEVQAKAREGVEVFRCRGLQLNNRSDDAALVLALISEGTSGWIGIEALLEIMKAFVGALCVGLTAHPVHDLLRGRVPALLKAWAKAGCRCIYVEDNAPDEECPDRDPLANDLGMITLIAAPISAAAATKDAAAESNNMHTLIFGLDEDSPNGEASAPDQDSLRLASFRTFSTAVPGRTFRPHPALVPRPYVIADTLTSTVITALKEVAKDARRAVSAQFGRPNTTRFDIIMTPLEPNSLRFLEDEVITARKTAATPPPPRNYQLLFAAMKIAIDALNPTCPVVAVSVESLADPEAHLRGVASPKLLLEAGEQPQLPAADRAGEQQPVADQQVEEAQHAT